MAGLVPGCAEGYLHALLNVKDPNWNLQFFRIRSFSFSSTGSSLAGPVWIIGSSSDIFRNLEKKNERLQKGRKCVLYLHAKKNLL